MGGGGKKNALKKGLGNQFKAPKEKNKLKK